jgi:hypothetical protein
MPLQLEARLRAHLQSRETRSELLFVNWEGRPFSANKLRGKQLHPLLAKLGIPRGGFHSLTHGAASSLFADGASPAVMQKQSELGAIVRKPSFVRKGRFACYAPHVMPQGRAFNCDFRFSLIFLS